MPTPAQQMLDAVLRGDTDTVAELLEADAQLANLADRTSQRFCVLQHAAYRGHQAIVELLLAAGANVNKRSHCGSFPLYQAVSGGHLEIARILIAAGAETRATTNDGYSAFNAAISSGNRALIDLLRDLPRATIRNTFRGKRQWD